MKHPFVSGIFELPSRSCQEDVRVKEFSRGAHMDHSYEVGGYLLELLMPFDPSLVLSSEPAMSTVSLGQGAGPSCSSFTRLVTLVCADTRCCERLGGYGRDSWSLHGWESGLLSLFLSCSLCEFLFTRGYHKRGTGKHTKVYKTIHEPMI